MPDVQEVFRMATQKIRPDEGFVDRQVDRQRRRSRGRKLGALALAGALAIAAVVFAIRLTGEEGRSQPAIQPNPPTAVPEVDYLLDLGTGAMTPLPTAIVGETDVTEQAISADGSMVAYVKPDADGSLQIFVANLDGSEVRQITHDDEAYAPSWSPDGTRIAYEAYGDGFVHNLFVVDLATETTTQVTSFEVNGVFGTQFTPDGSSLVYAGGDKDDGVRLAPISGGKHTLLVGGGGTRGDAGNGSLSRDGSMLTYAFSALGGGPERWISNADGSDPRPLVEDGPFLGCNPAGTWSPDSSQLVCSDGIDVVVVAVATGEVTKVAEGEGAIWLDDHTLLIDV